jgi:basic membrane protein A
VIYAAAGATGVGVMEAAKERGKYAIGGSSKKFSNPDTILTYTVKRVDFPTFQAFAMAQQGSWKGGKSTLGLKEGVIDWTLPEYNEKAITPELKAKVEAAKADIVAGKIAVHDYESNNACKR